MNASSLPVLKNEIRKFVIDTFLFGSDEGMADETSFLANGIIDSTGCSNWSLIWKRLTASK